MRTIFEVMLEVICDWLREIAYYIKSNLRHFAKILALVLPYVMYFIGQYVHNARGKMVVGSEIIIPLVISFIIYFVQAYANKIGKGTSTPVPSKRFTEVSDDGEVSIDNARIQELILYIADLEDHFERKGLL